MAGFAGNARAYRPQTVASPDGVRRSGVADAYVQATRPVFNDHPTDAFPAHSVIITGANTGAWRSGRLATGEDAGDIYIPCDLSQDSINYNSGHMFMGITIGVVPPASWGVVATAGIVPVRCNAASGGEDAGMLVRGGWVRWSANSDDDPGGLLGTVESISAANLVSATVGTSRPGSVVGQIIIPAGIDTSVGQTGSKYVAIIRIHPR